CARAMAVVAATATMAINVTLRIDFFMAYSKELSRIVARCGTGLAMPIRFSLSGECLHRAAHPLVSTKLSQSFPPERESIKLPREEQLKPAKIHSIIARRGGVSGGINPREEWHRSSCSSFGEYRYLDTDLNEWIHTLVWLAYRAFRASRRSVRKAPG